MKQTISEYSSMSKEEFKELILIGRLKTRFELAYFILNTLHHIVNSGGWYCHCHHFEEGRKYKFFSIPMIFKDFEKDIERNIFDVNFLFNYYTKLCHELLELFDKKKMVSNAFRQDMNLVAQTGTLVSIGLFLSLKIFSTMKRS